MKLSQRSFDHSKEYWGILTVKAAIYGDSCKEVFNISFYWLNSQKTSSDDHLAIFCKLIRENSRLSIGFEYTALYAVFGKF